MRIGAVQARPSAAETCSPRLNPIMQVFLHAFPAACRPAPVVRAIHWTARSWALAFSLGNSTLAQGTELVAANGQKSVRPVFRRPLASTPTDTRRGIKSGNRHMARFLSPPGDRSRPPHLDCRGVLSKWQTRCLLTRLILKRRV